VSIDAPTGRPAAARLRARFTVPYPRMRRQAARRRL